MDTDGRPVPWAVRAERAGERFALDTPATTPGARAEGPLALGPPILVCGEDHAGSPGPAATESEEEEEEEPGAVEGVESESEEPEAVEEPEPVEQAEAVEEPEAVEKPEPAEKEPAESGWRRPSLVSIIVIAGAVLTAIIVLVISARDKPPARAHHEGQSLAVEGRVDSFDRPDDPSSLTGPASLLWTVASGTFGIVDNQAFAAPKTTPRSLAVVNLGQPDGAAAVRVTKVRTNAGLVFRYHDSANYWAVVAVREYATWVIVHVVSGRQDIVANTGLSTTSDGTTVAVRLRGTVFDIALNGRVVKTITDPTVETSTGIGITAMDSGREVAHFDDFTATLR